MGYRSEVYIKVPKEDKDELLKLIKDNGLENIFEEDDDHNDDYFRLEGSWLKWYDSYTDVTAINNFILDSTEDHPRGLIRVGEDSHTEHYGDTFDLDMYENTTIEW